MVTGANFVAPVDAEAELDPDIPTLIGGMLFLSFEKEPGHSYHRRHDSQADPQAIARIGADGAADCRGR
jgi:hypothetical protein